MARPPRRLGRRTEPSLTSPACSSLLILSRLSRSRRAMLLLVRPVRGGGWFAISWCITIWWAHRSFTCRVAASTGDRRFLHRDLISDHTGFLIERSTVKFPAPRPLPLELTLWPRSALSWRVLSPLKSSQPPAVYRGPGYLHQWGWNSRGSSVRCFSTGRGRL